MNINLTSMNNFALLSLYVELCQGLGDSHWLTQLISEEICMRMDEI